MKPSELDSRLLPLRDNEKAYKNIILSGKVPDSEFGATFALNNVPQTKPSALVSTHFIRESSHVIGMHQHTRYFPVHSHSHDFMEIMYVYSGECTNIVENSRIKLTAGDICIVAPDVNHLPIPENDSVLVNFIVRRKFLGSLSSTFSAEPDGAASGFFGSVAYGSEYPMCLYASLEREERLLCDLLICEELEPNRTELGEVTAIRLLELLMLYLMRRERIELVGCHRPERNSVSSMLQFIADNHVSLTLGALADNFHYSEEHICRLLKNETGHTFTKLLRSARAEKAKELLCCTSMSLEDISAKVGYDCITNFYRSFKSETGVPPGKYRELNK